MTTRTVTTPAIMPTVTTDQRQIIVHTGRGRHHCGYVDLIDADGVAANLRGALADAHTVGARDLAYSIAHTLDDLSDTDGALNGADAVEALYRILEQYGAVTTCDVCCVDHAADRPCPYCTEGE